MPEETTPDAGAETAETTFTQADLDRVVADRLAREKRAHDKQIKMLRDTLGIDDAADLTEALAAMREQAERAPKPAAKPKPDELNAIEARAKAEIEKVQTEAAENTRKYHKQLIENEIRIQIARESNRITADAPLLFANELRRKLGVDPETMEVIPVDTEGGRIRDAKAQPLAMTDLVDALLTEFPSLVRAPGGGSGAHPSGRTQTNLIDTLVDRARRSGTRQDADAVASAVFHPTR